MTASHVRGVVASVVLVGLLAACGGSGGGTAGGGRVKVSEKEFKITLSTATVPAGDITFSLENKGTVPHEFVVFKTGLAPDSLPLGADGNVDEEGTGVPHTTEQAEFTAGNKRTFPADRSGGRSRVQRNPPARWAGSAWAAGKQCNLGGKWSLHWWLSRSLRRGRWRYQPGSI